MTHRSAPVGWTRRVRAMYPSCTEIQRLLPVTSTRGRRPPRCQESFRVRRYFLLVRPEPVPVASSARMPARPPVPRAAERRRGRNARGSASEQEQPYRLHRTRQRGSVAGGEPPAPRRGPHGARPQRGSGRRFRRQGRQERRLAARHGGGLRHHHHLPALACDLCAGRRGSGWHSRGPQSRQALARDEHDRLGRDQAARAEGRSERRHGHGLPGVGRLPSCRHRQHLDLRRRLARSVRACPAGALDPGPPDPAHGRDRLGLDAEGDDELPVHRAPGGARRGAHDLQGHGHGHEHHLRGHPHLVGQLVRARDGIAGDPERQPRHRLHDGPRHQGRRPVRPARDRPQGAARTVAADREDLQGRGRQVRPAREFAEHHPALRRTVRLQGARARASRRRWSTTCPKVPGFEVVPRNRG